MDELESELRTLDREIAQFVVEAFQREAPEALRAQLAAAIADSLQPLQRTLETLGGALAEGARQSASLRADIAQRAGDAQAQAERRTSELRQALTGMRNDLALARREIQQAAGPSASPTPGPRAPLDAFVNDERNGRLGPSPSEGGWWIRRWTWVAGGVAALAVAVGVVLVFIRPAGPIAAPTAAGAGGPPAAGGASTAAAGPLAADQEGFARILAQVSGAWSGERRSAALATLCGAGADATGCPDLQKRWLAGGRSRKEVEAAMAVTLAALAETDGCTPPGAAPAAAGSDRRHKGAGPAADDTDPLAAWTCLLTEAGRAPRP